MIKIPQNKCTGCYACVTVCPIKCISMASDQEGFLYPQVDTQKCINCRLCEKICPILNPMTIKKEHAVAGYAAYSKNEEVRFNSSSGGIFSLLAEYVIAHGGVVFGVGFTDEFEVIHLCVDTLEGLKKLRGSKYVQSQIGDTFQQAHSFLEKGRLVLFTGTPCQIGGLLSFLKNEYDNLITQDIICHGVPSPMVWKKYITYREKYASSPVQRIAFRRKNEGWKRFSVSFLFENGEEYRQIFDKDLMMTAFLKNICLRPSCYNCSFKTLNRQSDITLADFWGIQEIMPEMDDDKGTSLVFVNSAKGQRLFNVIKENMIYQEVKIETAVRYNSAMIASVPKNIKREAFFSDIQNNNFDKVVNKYCCDSFTMQVKNKIHKIFIKIRKMFLNK